MHLPGARPYQIASGVSGIVVVNGAALLRGWSLRETTGSAAAVVELYDGTSTGGMLVATISLTDAQSTRDYLEGSGVEIRNAIFYNVVSGAVKASIWASPGEFAGGYVFVRGAVPVP